MTENIKTKDEGLTAEQGATYSRKSCFPVASTAETTHVSKGSRPARLIPLPEVLFRTGFGKSFVYEEIAAGRFPQPIKKLGASRRGAVRWLESDIENWILA